jgi:hypothetical protein
VPLPWSARKSQEPRGWRRASRRSGNFLANAFPYDSDRDCFTCAAGKILTRRIRFSRGHGVYTRVYHAGKTVCAPCPFRSQCAPVNAQPGGRGAITHIEEPPATTAFKAKMTTEEAQQIYAQQRSQIAEFPQAWITERCGLRQFRRRGRWPVSMEATWACLSYNHRTMVQLAAQVQDGTRARLTPFSSHTRPAAQHSASRFCLT